jgi:ABC-type transport system substrate-binding protein
MRSTNSAVEAATETYAERWRQLVCGIFCMVMIANLVATEVPPQIEKIIAISLNRIGISVNVKRVTEAEFLEQLYLPKFKSGGAPLFEILLLSVPAGTILHAAMVPMTLLYSREPNESVIHDEKIDEIYLAGLRTYDRDEGRQIWRQLEEYVAANHLLFFGYQERAVFGANARLKFTPRTLMTFWDAYYEPRGGLMAEGHPSSCV